MRLRTLILVLAALALVAGACGDDDDGGVLTDDETATTAASDDGGDGSASGTFSDDFCGFAAEAEDFDPFSALSGTEMPTPDQLREGWTESVEFVDQAVDEAPAEISDDFAVLADYLDAFTQVFESIDYDFQQLISDPELAQEFAGLESEFDLAALEEASNNVAAWFQENCGIDVSG